MRIDNDAVYSILKLSSGYEREDNISYTNIFFFTFVTRPKTCL